MLVNAAAAASAGDIEGAIEHYGEAKKVAKGEVQKGVEEQIGLLRIRQEQLFGKEMPEGGWTCEACGRPVDHEQSMCPYCEQGAREERRPASPVLGEESEARRDGVQISEARVCRQCGREKGGKLMECPYCEGERESETLVAEARPEACVDDLPTGKRRTGIWAWAVVLVAVGMMALAGCNIATRPRITPTSPPPPTEAAMALPTAAPTMTQIPNAIATAVPAEDATRISPMDGMVQVYVPAGSFLMGSKEGQGEIDERPEHEVYLEAFWIDQTEVTNAMYAAFLNAEGNQSEGGVRWLVAGRGYVRIHEQGGSWQVDEGYEDHPVVEVSWYGARAYCEWAGRRMPTEAEWEKAARGVNGMTYPWGNARVDCTRAQYDGCSGEMVPVGSKPAGASPYGALDLAGNVWEWVADWYGEDYYEMSPGSNPQGPSNGDSKVFRGGSWNDHPGLARVAARIRSSPSNSYINLGFRCSTSP